MRNSIFICFSILGLITSSCRKTPSANYLPKPLGEDQYAPWDAPVYTYDQLAAFFPGEDYTSLTQVYVSKTGNDASGDGTLASPYLTIQYAIDQNPSPGTVINVLNGTYVENVQLDVEGTFDLPYVLLSYDGPGAAIIDGDMNAGYTYTVQLSGKFNILDGFEVKNGPRYTVLVTTKVAEGANPFGGGDCNSVVRNNIVHTAVQDVIKCGHLNYVLIEKNDVSGSLQEKQADQCIDGVGVYHSLCRWNYLHDNGDGGGGYFKGGSTNNIWCFNVVANMEMSAGGLPEYNAWGIQSGGSGQFSYRDQAWTEYPAGHEQLIHSNIFINCQGSAVSVISAWDTKIYNNTIYNCGSASSEDVSRNSIFRAKVSSGSTDNGVRSSGLDIRNNVSYNDAANPVFTFFSQQNSEHSTVLNDYNCFYNVNGGAVWNFPSGATATNIQSNPLFTDVSSCDFSLTASSPCLDGGQNLTSVTYGIAASTCTNVTTIIGRPQNLYTDIGAYEQ